jgi:hypothetical protein
MVRRGFDESFSTAPPNLLPLIPLIPEKSADLAPAYGKPLEQNRNNDFRISEYVDRQ